MCRRWRVLGRAAIFVLTASLALPQEATPEGTVNERQFDALSNTLLKRAQDEVERTRVLVEQGTLPKSQLKEAENRLDDARDEAVLTETLYGTTRLEDMTAEQAAAMVAAADRRVEREAAVVQERKTLLDAGVIARAEFAVFTQELEARKRTLELARNRAKLLDELQQMAATEQKLERDALRARDLVAQGVMIRYDGSGVFKPASLKGIAGDFQAHFHRPLPVSAVGETAIHRAMGLDHRNRVDIALSPDQPEGIWLRHLLEQLQIPYLAFRSAVAGAATAPHIHIGTGSTKLAIAQK